MLPNVQQLLLSRLAKGARAGPCRRCQRLHLRVSAFGLDCEGSKATALRRCFARRRCLPCALPVPSGSCMRAERTHRIAQQLPSCLEILRPRTGGCLSARDELRVMDWHGKKATAEERLWGLWGALTEASPGPLLLARLWCRRLEAYRI